MYFLVWFDENLHDSYIALVTSLLRPLVANIAKGPIENSKIEKHGRNKLTGRIKNKTKGDFEHLVENSGRMEMIKVIKLV